MVARSNAATKIDSSVNALLDALDDICSCILVLKYHSSIPVDVYGVMLILSLHSDCILSYITSGITS